MTDPIRSPVAQRVGAAIGLFLAMTLVAGTTLIVLSPAGAPECSSVDRLVERRAAGPRPVQFILVDLASNHHVDVERIVDDLRDTLESGLRHGVRFVLIADRGGTTTLTPDRCLDGSRSFVLNDANQDLDRASVESGVEALRSHVIDYLESTRVEDLGSSLRLVKWVAVRIDALLPSEDRDLRIDPIVLHSDFMGVQDDCLNVERFAPTSAGVDAMIANCRTTDGLPSIPVPLHIFGAGASSHGAGHEEYAVSLASALCVAIVGTNLVDSSGRAADRCRIT